MGIGRGPETEDPAGVEGIVVEERSFSSEWWPQRTDQQDLCPFFSYFLGHLWQELGLREGRADLVAKVDEEHLDLQTGDRSLG